MILMYHNLAEEAGFNTVSRSNFQEQMGWLSSKGYEVVSMDAYVQGLKSGYLTPKRIAITFDDAYVSYHEVALPVLREFSFPSTAYVPTDFVGKSNVWDDGDLPILNWSDLKSIASAKDVIVGSHGKSHSHMRELDSQVLSQEVRESKAILERELNVKVSHFSYPFGQLRDFDARCLREIESAGYSSACSTIWSRVNSAGNLFSLHRLEVEPSDDLAQFSSKISRTFHPKFFRQKAKNALFRLHLRR